MPLSRGHFVGFSARHRDPFRPLAAILLALALPCQLLPSQSLPAPDATPASPKADTRPGAKPEVGPSAKLDANQRILHLLSRFTFGPTPEEIAAVRALGAHGIDLWFDAQLHPGSIPDARLDALLARYPAMQLPVDQLLLRFPSGAVIRQAANGKRPIPNNRYLAAIYRRHIDLYEEKQAKKAEEKSEAAKAPQTQPDAAMTEAMTKAMTEAMTKAMTAAQPGPAARMAPPAAPLPAAEPAAAANSRPTYAGLLVSTVLALPPAQRVDRIVAMRPGEYDQFRSSIKGPRKAKLTGDLNPGQRELLADFDNPSRAVVEELQDQRLLRDIASSRQLQEVMTTFWLNHFNVYLHKNEEAPYYLVSYERDAIRPRALGNFEDLLVATAQSPAMLQYLDNSSSAGPHSEAAEKHQAPIFGKDKNPAPGLNENYARELMELHTLGVDGGYTQKDVTEVARIFTGWTVDKPQQGGGFKFDASRHEPGKKIVMGRKFKENGQKEGLQLLHMLATSPATAHFISRELAAAFLSDTPPPAVVNRMAQSFLRTHGDIPSVLKTLLHSPEFWSPAAYRAKVKTPLEYVVSAARLSRAEIADPRPLVNALNQMGMPLYGCVPPTGYSSKADAWVSTGELVTRMNFALSLATGHTDGITPGIPDATRNLAGAPEAEQALEAMLVPGGVTEKSRTAVLDQAQPAAQIYPPRAESMPVADGKPNISAQTAALDKRNALIAGLLLGSPEFQRR